MAHLRLFQVLLVYTMLASLTSCQANQRANAPFIVTERQESRLCYFIHLTEEIFPTTVAIDVPAEGSQTVMDSLTLFLNETLYRFFDNGDDRHLPSERVFSRDLKQLAEHYRKAYAPISPSDTTDTHEWEADCLEINLVAQTDTYLTYEIAWVFYGEGVETATEWVTFAKSDGHRLTGIISDADLLRFYEDYPQYRNESIAEDLRYQSNHEGTLGNAGLLGDSVAHQYVYAPGIFEDTQYPLEVIAPYLSKEAQQLIHSTALDCL